MPFDTPVVLNGDIFRGVGWIRVDENVVVADRVIRENSIVEQRISIYIIAIQISRIGKSVDAKAKLIENHVVSNALDSRVVLGVNAMSVCIVIPRTVGDSTIVDQATIYFSIGRFFPKTKTMTRIVND